MGAMAAGEDRPFKGNGIQHFPQSRVGGKPFLDAHIVDVLQIVRRVDALVDHQAPERGAVPVQVFLSELAGPFLLVPSRTSM